MAFEALTNICFFPFTVTMAGVLCAKATCGRLASQRMAPVLAKLPNDDSLRQRIDIAVDHTLNNRTLNTRTHNAWQVVHGILPYGFAFQIEHDGQRIGALEWLLSGGALKGWDLGPGDHGVLEKHYTGSKDAKGQHDQWIGYLSQGGLDG